MRTNGGPTARCGAGFNEALTTSLGVNGDGQLSSFSSAQLVSAMPPYNPREWVGSSSGEARSPPAPPPYSPRRNNHGPMSSVEAVHSANMSASRAPAPTQNRRPASVAPTTCFPPPPGSRGTSRERRFGLPSLGRRREADPQSRHTPKVHGVPLSIRIPGRSEADAVENLPPGSRRAVSTPATATPTSARWPSSSQVRWEAGMPLPPPPPGPPPTTVRSQSAQRPSTVNNAVASPWARRPPPAGVAALGPVPPTPANWVDTVDGESQEKVVLQKEGACTLTSPPGSAGLSRSHAVRDKTLREVRNESRTQGGSTDASLANIVVIPAESRPSGSTTPPFSPQPWGSRAKCSAANTWLTAPRALPTPPPQPQSGSSPGLTRQAVLAQTTEQFARASVQRFQWFAASEAAASDDAERVRVFANFFVGESRVRRERYAGAIDAMGSEVLDLTRDVFRPMTAESKAWATSPFASTSEPSSVTLSNYMPSLSPIPSMSVSDARDGQDSRGRPSSRWWETDSNGAASAAGLSGLSKQESKYMGVPKEAREALQWADDDAAAGCSTSDALGGSRSVLTRASRDLDVSRLVTLPPPYPRHHPAVQNSHPDLADVRNELRLLGDMSEMDATHERFAQTSARRRADVVRKEVHDGMGLGPVGHVEAAGSEADIAEENRRAHEVEKTDFDEFQAAVVVPLNEVLQERIARATTLFDKLLLSVEEDPNPQEQGDERPELLEKLTLLKWIFEAREALHGALHHLLHDRNARYRDLVLMPYRLNGADDDVASTTAFFADHAQRRDQTEAEQALRRAQDFRDALQPTVARAVEVQLGAFWDLAPPLRRLLDAVPATTNGLAGFSIIVPPAETAENPAYATHPLQYLYGLLLHAERSTHQFIEAQTNLLCLLHEVREAAVTAKARLRQVEGRAPHRVEEARREETARLTDDMQEKVRLVQDQWNQALGDSMRSVKERVRAWLLQTGGWDESLEDRGVGGSW